MAENNATKIGLSTATITGMNAMIGSGIFAIPAILAKNVGPAGILAFIFVVISVWFIAQSLAHVAKLFPQEGSFYTYAKQWGGHTMGLISSGSYIIGLLIAMGLLCQIVGHHLKYFFHGTSAEALGIIALTTIIVINMFGVSLSQLGQRILILLTVFPMLVTIGICLTKLNFGLLSPFAPYGFTNILRATQPVLFAFFGFECASALYSSVKNPEKNVPKALTYSILFVGAIYILFVGSILLSTPADLFISERTTIPEVLNVLFPHYPWIATIINISIISAILGTIHSMVWACSSLLFSFFKKIKKPLVKNVIAKGILNKTVCVLLIGIIIFLSYTMIKKINLFFSLAILFIVFAYITSIMTLLFMKDQWKSKQNIKTILGIITASIIVMFAAKDLIVELIK